MRGEELARVFVMEVDVRTISEHLDILDSP